MSRKAVDRLGVIQQAVGKQLRPPEAARRLGLSVRQVQRLVLRYRADGAAGLISRHRGKRPHNAFPASLRPATRALGRAHYADFGPTLAGEKLAERHDHHLSVETLRQWMIAEGLWPPKTRQPARIHPRRPRRPCRGELVPIDGSPHAWFEERRPQGTLIGFIDDATSELLALRFVPAETTHAYLTVLGPYRERQGRPVALYSDQHRIFRVNHPEHDGAMTPFTRALQTLDIESIHAHGPPAKGRGERANQTLQDRLVKELRRRGSSDLERANAFLPQFIADDNQRFAGAPQNPVAAHRPGRHPPEELALIRCRHHPRTLSKNLSFQFKNREYQLPGQGRGYRLSGARITVCEATDGTVTLLHKGRHMPDRILAEGEATGSPG